MHFWYNAGLRLLALLAVPLSPLLLVLPKVREGLGSRLGFYSRADREAFGDLPRPRVWFHAASVGELTAIAPIAAAFKERSPNVCILVSCMTLHGLKLAGGKIPSTAKAFLAPLDLPRVVRRVFSWAEPDMLVIAETELWPNLLREAKRRGCQLALVNGRMAERSFRRYQRVKSLLRAMLGRFDLLAVQTQKDADRFIALGANPQRLKITGNVKFDAAPAAEPASLLRELRVDPSQPVWVAGSTRPGEEDLVLDAFARVREKVPNAVLILAPRHLERLREVEKILAKRRADYSRRSQLAAQLVSSSIILLDTMGELSRLYSVARVAFVGGSLVPLGGHNPVEPAALGVAVLVGPHTEHFSQTAAMLVASGGAAVVSTAADLAAEVIACLASPAEAIRRGRLALDAVAANQGAAGQSAALLQKLMLIKRWGSEVKDWRVEAAMAGTSAKSAKDGMLDDWPEWPV